MNFTAKPSSRCRTNTSDAGADSKRRSDLRLRIGRDRGTRRRHVDEEAGTGAAIGECQRRVGAFGDDARLPALIAPLRVLLLLLQPGQLACKLLALGMGNGEIKQERAIHGVADVAVELAEVAESKSGDRHFPTTGTCTIIRNGDTQLVRQAKLRGLPCGSNQLGSV